jgi:hypothetical protein
MTAVIAEGRDVRRRRRTTYAAGSFCRSAMQYHDDQQRA